MLGLLPWGRGVLCPEGRSSRRAGGCGAPRPVPSVPASNLPVCAESFRVQYLQFLAYTKTPQYKANLQQLLDQEKVGLGAAVSFCLCPAAPRPWLLVEGALPQGSPLLLLQEKKAQLLGTARQLFSHCQAQKEEIRRLFQQKLDEVGAGSRRALTLAGAGRCATPAHVCVSVCLAGGESPDV